MSLDRFLVENLPIIFFNLGCQAHPLSSRHPKGAFALYLDKNFDSSLHCTLVVEVPQKSDTFFKKSRKQLTKLIVAKEDMLNMPPFTVVAIENKTLARVTLIEPNLS